MDEKLNYLAEVVKDLIFEFNKAGEDSGVLIIGTINDRAIIAGNKNSPAALACLLAGAMEGGTREHDLLMAAIEYYLRHNFEPGKRMDFAFDGKPADDVVKEMISAFSKKVDNEKENPC